MPDCNLALNKLKESINHKGGSIPLDEFVGFCLGDSQYGYYRSNYAIGKANDFITAPEISQIFGEMIGVWLLNQWHIAGEPVNIAILELGPGRGLLMRDILRTFAIRTKLIHNIKVHLLEINDFFRVEQVANIDHHSIDHHSTIEQALEQIEDSFLFVVANEFFDALPAKQYVYKNNRWHEKHVAFDKVTGTLCYLDKAMHDCNFNYGDNLVSGSITEESKESREIFNKILHCLNNNGGSGLVIDYGYNKLPYKSTLEAICKHKFANPLTNLGHTDLSFHVNFESLYNMVIEAGLNGILSRQADFLRQQGIELRQQQLVKDKDPQTQQNIFMSTQRLIDSTAMGSLFKVLQFYNI